ncbi:MAG: peptidylprolyl isomerase, partial [Bacteroidales bacterium]
DFSDTSIAKGKNKIFEIYNKIKAGESFEELAKKYSEDKSSAVKGGVMAPFATGRMVPEFEAASFALKNKGDISEPIKTDYGWHIIKKIDLKPLPSFEDAKADIKAKILKDVRSELPKRNLINKIKKENNFVEYKKNLSPFYTLLDTTYFQGKWNAEKADNLKEVLFKLANKNYTQKDFAKYLAEHQVSRAPGSFEVIVNNQFEKYVDDATIEHENSKLEQKYPEFKNLMNEYRDGILLFELTDNKVWSKAVKDSVGLKDFYEKNKNKYTWEQRVDATIYTCATEDVSKKVRELLKDKKVESDILNEINKNSQLELKIENGKYSKGENKAIDLIQWQEGISNNIEVYKSNVFVDVHKILPSEPKTLAEAKGLVTVDYQNVLEKEWIEQLRKKYPVTVNKEILSTIK